MAGGFVSKHPYLTGGAVLAIIVLFMMLRGGGSSGQTVVAGGTTVDPSVVGAGMQLQAMQAQLASHAQDVAAETRARQDEGVIQLAIAKLNAEQNTLNMNLQTQLASKSLDVQSNLATMQTAMTAQIEGAKIHAQEQAMQLQHADTVAQINATLESAKASNLLMEKVTTSNIELQKQNQELQAATSKALIESNTKLGMEKERTVQKTTGGLCFLTTACCEAMGLPDDCNELETLRFYRDVVMPRHLGKGRALEICTEYKRVAPDIIAGVNRKLEPSEANVFWRAMYHHRILPIVYLVQHQRYDEAFKAYYELVNDHREFATLETESSNSWVEI